MNLYTPESFVTGIQYSNIYINSLYLEMYSRHCGFSAKFPMSFKVTKKEESRGMLDSLLSLERIMSIGSMNWSSSGYGITALFVVRDSSIDARNLILFIPV